MWLLSTLQGGCLIGFMALLLAAAWQDLRTMRIANGLSLAIVACFAVSAIAGLALGKASAGTVAANLVVGLGVFAAGCAAFAVGAVGGGDVKLLAAASLFAGPALLADLMLAAALAGGVMAVAMLAGLPVGPGGCRGMNGVAAPVRGRLPCGPAIAAGGMWVAVSSAIS